MSSFWRITIKTSNLKHERPWRFKKATNDTRKHRFRIFRNPRKGRGLILPILKKEEKDKPAQPEDFNSPEEDLGAIGKGWRGNKDGRGNKNGSGAIIFFRVINTSGGYKGGGKFSEILGRGIKYAEILIWRWGSRVWIRRGRSWWWWVWGRKWKWRVKRRYRVF